ncbi:conserved hypothetical protein [Flavobacteria bacterium BBFL7]|nr:conserved hypothetical protein [Flavobacteria bacterium BBFL7]
MENILIAGAHGTTGKKIVNLLNQSSQYHPIAMVRKQEQVDYFKTNGIDTVLADLEQDVSPAFNKSIDKVLFAAGSGGKKVVEVDQEGAKKLVDAAKNHGIKKFVMLSSLGAENPEEATELKDYLKAKHNADEYLKSSGLNYTIVRPGSLTNESLTNHITLEKSLNKSGEISRNDVAMTLTTCLTDNLASNQTFEIINGDTLINEALDTFSATHA